LAYNPRKGVPRPLKIFYNQTDCRAYLETLCRTFSLCPKFCHLQQTHEACSHHEIKGCEGICSGKEAIGAYNLKVQQAIDHMGRSVPELKIIKERGRDEDEEAVVLIADGLYKGYGFIDRMAQLS